MLEVASKVLDNWKAGAIQTNHWQNVLLWIMQGDN